MKKMLKPILVITVALMVFTGCSKKSSWTMTIQNDGHFSVVTRPDIGTVGSFGWQEGRDGEKSSGEFSVKKDGECSMVVMDEDGKEYTITIINNNGKAEIKADEGISVDLKQK